MTVALNELVDDRLTDLDQWGVVEVYDETPGRKIVTVTYLEKDNAASVLKGARIVANFIQDTQDADVTVYHMAANAESVSFFLHFPYEITDDKVVA